MVKYRIIGNMTGNSMDAIDLVLTEFENDQMTDICSFSKPYSQEMRQRIESLRKEVFQKSKTEIENIPSFHKTHDCYVTEIAEAVLEMCRQNHLSTKTIDAIGFHGKTLDHFPPSVAKRKNEIPYTLQMGSGQMLADLTGIPTIYDFRSDFIMNGFEGAPLIAPHNAKISKTEGDGIYFNGGNTSNFALISGGKVLISTDAGPFNEYTDAFVRTHFHLPFDDNGKLGTSGKLDISLLQTLFDFGRTFYETDLPKSGDPAYYFKNKIFQYISEKQFEPLDVLHTFEYFAAYISVFTLACIPPNLAFPKNIILFGGGWKNKVTFTSFKNLLKGIGTILKEHKNLFSNLQKRLPENLSVFESSFGHFMEARLMADLAYHKLCNIEWKMPEVLEKRKHIVCGKTAFPQTSNTLYTDKLSRASKGWKDI